MIDLDAELLDNQEDIPPPPIDSNQNEVSIDKNYKGIDMDLLGFHQDGIIENMKGDQQFDDLYAEYGRQK